MNLGVWEMLWNYLGIVALRKFIEFMIYSDGEVHPKELEFLNNWNTTLDIKSKYF